MPSTRDCSACKAHGVACLEHAASPLHSFSGIFLIEAKVLTISSSNPASAVTSPSVQGSGSRQLPTRCSEVSASAIQQGPPSNQRGMTQGNESSTDSTPVSASSISAIASSDQRPGSFTARDSTKLNILASASMDPRLHAALTPPPKSPYEQSNIPPIADDQPAGSEAETQVKEEGNDASTKALAKSETLEPNNEVKKYQSRKVTEAGRSKLFPPAWKKPPGV